MRELEGENLKERGDLSAAKAPLFLCFLPSNLYTAPNKNIHRTQDKDDRD